MEEDDSLTLASLNDDCLFEILKFLDIASQQQLLWTCKRFEEPVLTYWRLKYKKWSNVNKKPDLQLKRILHCICSFVEELDLGCIGVEQVLYLKSMQFPKTQYLLAEVEPAGDLTYTEIFHIITNSFPALTKLSLESNIPLKLFATIANLTELELHVNAMGDEMNSFHEIFTQLKLRKISLGYVTEMFNYNRQDFLSIFQCKTLEDIYLPGELLEMVVPRIDELPRAHILVCTNKDHDLYPSGELALEIFQRIGQRIFTLGSNYLFVCGIQLDKLIYLKNLEKLIMKDFRIPICRPSFIADNFKNLRELHLLMLEPKFQVQCDRKPRNVMLLEILEASYKLEVLFVARDWILANFIYDDLLNIVVGQQYRRMPLELRFMDNNQIKDYKSLKDWSNGRNDPMLILTISEYPKYPKNLNWIKYKIWLDHC